MPQPPPIAKAAEPPGRSSRQTVSAETLLSRVREHLQEGRVVQARGLAAEAARDFPDHPEVQNAARVLQGGVATSRPGAEPSTDEEFEWLQSPPSWARGKWVALVGREAVASATTLAEVMDAIRDMDLPKKPLVHRIA